MKSLGFPLGMGFGISMEAHAGQFCSLSRMYNINTSRLDPLSAPWLLAA